MKKRMRTSVLVAVVLMAGIPGALVAFDGGGSSTGLTLDTYGLTKEDLRRHKPQSESWKPEEAAETGRLEATRDEPASPSTETDGAKDRSIDPWP